MRYAVRGPHPGRGPGRWTVVDTEDRDIAVDHCRTKREAQDVARELNTEGDPPVSWWRPNPEKAAELRAKMDEQKGALGIVPGADRFEGVTIQGGQVRYKDQAVTLQGARAHVESAGEIERRFTATRLVAFGVLALAIKKSKDKRELYLTVEGEDGVIFVEVSPKKSAKARAFAARINDQAARA